LVPWTSASSVEPCLCGEKGISDLPRRHEDTKTPRKQNLSGTTGSLGRHEDVRPEINRVLLPGSTDRFDEPQATSAFRKKRTPTKTGKRQRMGLARLAVTSTRFAVAIPRDGCVAGCWQDDFRRRHSAKNPRTCPCSITITMPDQPIRPRTDSRSRPVRVTSLARSTASPK